MSFLFKVTVMTGLLLATIGTAHAAEVDNEVLRDGVKEICDDAGGDFYDAGDSFGCQIDDLDATIFCVEDVGCVVEETPRRRPVTVRVKAALGQVALIKGIKTRASYCATAEGARGSLALKQQKKFCTAFGLPVGSDRIGG